MPVDSQMPGQRRDGRVVMGQRVDRPTDRARGQYRPGCDQLVRLRPRAFDAVSLGAAPYPLEPHDPHRRAEARRVRRAHTPAAVPDREHAATRATGRVGVGLDRDHQLAVAAAHVEHVHARR